MKLLHITTVPESLIFLKGQIGYMKAQGFEIRALSSPGERLDQFAQSESIQVKSLSIFRKISPWKDLWTIAQIFKYIRIEKPKIVHSHTPKGGLLGTISALLGMVPVRIYHIHGLPLMTAKGFKRQILWWSEKIACSLATQVLCVSSSIREVAIEEGLCPPNKIKVLLRGSCNGVDAMERFNPKSLPSTTRTNIRQQYEIPDKALVLGFVGRLVRDKGIHELVDAWKLVRDEFPSLHLLIVGFFESKDPIFPDAKSVLEEDPRIHLVGKNWETPPFYSAMDLLVLPTYREGFGNVFLEAAAMELPVVATQIPGCIDAIDNNTTGLLVPPQDPVALKTAISHYLLNSDTRLQHGSAGRERVLEQFRQEAIWEALHKEYCRLLAEKNNSNPMRFIQIIFKYILDKIVATFLLILLSPAILVLYFAVLFSMGRPVFFQQQRPGYQGKIFKFCKFRTMTDARDSNDNLLPDEQRLTAVGQFLRHSSLDELPQLWNVLKGDMSFVGPRPLLVEYLDLYTPEQARRHQVKPGITGWAQVNGRNALSWEKKFELDVWYVDNWSLWLDLKILMLTVIKVFKKEGISGQGHVTMSKFKGTIPSNQSSS
ncbi:glycosyl transferase possibly involved in lipopolysaccharide synthesis [Rivularia sp. PCC 7116]|uniref:sugar transferase n=1 Tax=Rivularia sp. PCC 7116 TaxID=373994 RepID=UPI00029F18A4|nr:sugar transferase [Rivularia sp. PCC 7116]AFY54692.1 glycosyl transferase possibly involved in lipopolysaccharide synthesis [Rivularia sp. PCC 7116]